MKREHFVKVVGEALDSLPREFRSRIRNVAVLVENMPPNQPSPSSGQRRRLLLGVFHGVPTTKESIFDLPMGPDYVVLYQKNIEAVCSGEAEVREQIRLKPGHEARPENPIINSSPIGFLRSLMNLATISGWMRTN
jgi:predicted Zn-dependent protease with MMP-like domain